MLVVHGVVWPVPWSAQQHPRPPQVMISEACDRTWALLLHNLVSRQPGKSPVHVKELSPTTAHHSMRGLLQRFSFTPARRLDVSRDYRDQDVPEADLAYKSKSSGFRTDLKVLLLHTISSQSACTASMELCTQSRYLISDLSGKLFHHGIPLLWR